MREKKEKFKAKGVCFESVKKKLGNEPKKTQTVPVIAGRKLFINK